MYLGTIIKVLLIWSGLICTWCVGAGTKDVEQHLQAACSAEVPQDTEPKLLIASHNRLLIHDIRTGKHRTLHAGSGVYYSTISSDTPGRIWVSTRPEKGGDAVMELDITAPRNRVVQRIPLADSHFTHEVVRYKNKVFVADTSTGSINILSFPDFKILRKIEKFGKQNHVNTLAVADDGQAIWAVYHNHGAPSFVAKFDTENGEILEQVNNIGNQAHGWVEYPHNSNSRLFLSSGDATLVHMNLLTREKVELYRSRHHSAKRRMFLKGLAVVKNIAYFGESEFKDRAGRATVPCTLVAYDLIKQQVVFEREWPGSVGLINTVSVYGLTNSTFTHVPWMPLLNDSVSCGMNDEQAYFKSLVQDARKTGFAYGTFPPDVDIVRLPFSFPIEDLQRDVANLVEKHGGWVSRPDVNNWFVLLVTKDGVIDDQSNVGPFDEVQSRLNASVFVRRVFRELGIVVGRTRLMMLKAGQKVKPHFDRTNHIRPPHGEPDVASGYWGRRFRIHIPILTDSEGHVKFHVGQTSLHFQAGGAYIFDNAKTHAVTNDWHQDRVHLVIDTVGGPRLFESILRGSKAEFYPSKKRLPPPVPRANILPFIERGSNEYDHVSIMKERWIDHAVFQPMSESSVRMFFGHITKDLVSPEDVGLVKDIFETFLYVWHRAPIQLDIWHDLLDPVICSKVILLNGLSLFEAVEPISRMVHYACYMDPKRDDTSVGPPCFIARISPKA